MGELLLLWQQSLTLPLHHGLNVKLPALLFFIRHHRLIILPFLAPLLGLDSVPPRILGRRRPLLIYTLERVGRQGRDTAAIVVRRLGNTAAAERGECARVALTARVTGRIGDGPLALVLLLVLARVGLLHALHGRVGLEDVAHHLVAEVHALLGALQILLAVLRRGLQVSELALQRGLAALALRVGARLFEDTLSGWGRKKKAAC